MIEKISRLDKILIGTTIAGSIVSLILIKADVNPKYIAVASGAAVLSALSLCAREIYDYLDSSKSNS